MIDIFIRFMEKIILFPHELFRRSWCYLPDNETALFVASPIGNRMDGRMENEFEKPERNFPYAQGSLSWNVRFSDRFTWASLMKGTVLFDNDYEFYQAATIDLRGFRENRFIGKQSFYQYSDLRLDMGKLKNPFTPLKYGLFAGFDYGRVWFPGERSHSWHTSYGGGIWLTFLNKFTTKYSWFGSTDSFRFAFELGLGF